MGQIADAWDPPVSDSVSTHRAVVFSGSAVSRSRVDVGIRPTF
jgi:hypothetical protein